MSYGDLAVNSYVSQAILPWMCEQVINDLYKYLSPKV